MIKKIILPLLWVSLIFTIASCNPKEAPELAATPFDTISDSNNAERNKIVVISDLHLGAVLDYSETVKHLDRLEQFLQEVRSSTTIKELIINGDLFDDWYVPTRVDTYGTGTHADFIRKTVAANQAVFDLFNGIIQDGNIKVTYIPGNHDMGFTADDSNVGMPGVHQARDGGSKYGIGKYSPDGYPKIVLEHGHRYDFFNALVPKSGQDFIYPPGYFYARIAANSFTDPTTRAEATRVPGVTLASPGNAEQRSKYVYYSLWAKVLDSIIYVKDSFTEPIYKTNVGGFTEDYAVNDILPYNSEVDGSIQTNLYNELFTQENWNARLRFNNVEIMTLIDTAIVGSLATKYIDEQSNVQYFQNPNSNIRIVMFGHTHKPMIKTYRNLENELCVYANSGTWVDKKTRDPNAAIDQDAIDMTFLTFYPMKSDMGKLQISLYQYKYGKHVLLNHQEIEL